MMKLYSFEFDLSYCWNAEIVFIRANSATLQIQMHIGVDPIIIYKFE